jgi:hypothetical protein
MNQGGNSGFGIWGFFGILGFFGIFWDLKSKNPNRE